MGYRTLRECYAVTEAMCRSSVNRDLFNLDWKKFLAAWWLWVDYDGSNFDEDFECPECAKLPIEKRVFILDGTVNVAVKKRHLASYPVHQHGPPGEPDEKADAAPVPAM